MLWRAGQVSLRLLLRLSLALPSLFLLPASLSAALSLQPLLAPLSLVSACSLSNLTSTVCPSFTSFLLLPDYENAIELYTEAIDLCPEEHAAEAAPYYCNRAACYIKLVGAAVSLRSLPSLRVIVSLQPHISAFYQP